MFDWFKAKPPETKLEALRRHVTESAELFRQCEAELSSMRMRLASTFATNHLSEKHAALYEEMDRVHERELRGYEVVTANVTLNAEREPATGGLASTVRHIIGE